MHIIDELKERGFIEQMTNEDEIKKLLDFGPQYFYTGYDPTADSLTIGHFMTLTAIAHLQKAGHKPIILLGGGTGMVGDPTDRTDMRRVMDVDEIAHNVNRFKSQMMQYLDFSEGNAIILDNSEWLMKLKYVPFIREYGIHFSVNRMLTADSYKRRFEEGLSFFEFNYQVMQAYDFLELYRRYGCRLQCGGNDQWSNIIAGADLIRRVEQDQAQGMTFTLLTTASGEKMGKSMQGAIWIDPEKTSPYEFYQYFRNVQDDDVIKFMKLLTFLTLEEIKEYESLKGKDLNKAKERLAFETTKRVHGEQHAIEAKEASRALFAGGVDSKAIPETILEKSAFENDEIGLLALMETCGLVGSRSEARRLVEQGAVSVNDTKVTDGRKTITINDFDEKGTLMIQKGKKVFHRVRLK